MSALTLNLVIEQGTDFDTSFSILNNDGSPLDLTNYTGVCHMNRSYTSTHPSTPLTVNFLNRVEGIISIALTASQTTLLIPGRYVYDLTITSPSNITTRPIEGIIEVSPGVF